MMPMLEKSKPVLQKGKDILTDRFGRYHQYLRISVTDKCNLRCFYCMPHEGMTFAPSEDLLTADEIIAVARTFTGLGVNKIRLTGGEPLVRDDLFEIISGLKKIEALDMLAMTTNGLLLKGNAHGLKTAGIDTLNISLDTLNPKKFIEITQRDSFNTVMAGIEEALTTGFRALKINVVVMKNINDDEVMDFIEWGKDKPLNIRFIEYMPFQDNHWQPESIVPYRNIKNQIEKQYDLRPITTDPSAVAKDFKLKNHTGTVSFITSMTNSFCRSCNRIRVTADGNIKACLFNDFEIPFRDELRRLMTDLSLTEPMLSEKIHHAILQKHKAHEPLDTLAKVANRPMISIGG